MIAQIPNGTLRIQQGPTVGIKAIMAAVIANPYRFNDNIEMAPAKITIFKADMMPR